MKLCRFSSADGQSVSPGLVHDDGTVSDLAPGGVTSLSVLFEGPDPLSAVRDAAGRSARRLPFASLTLHPPVERQEIWAAGVTYLRSKTARMEESDFSASAYDRVYDADRPEIFFKAIADKVVGTGNAVGIRADAKWNVPEPELALVMNSRGTIVGCTIGNDMSSRDIEGENLLYLSQAKIYDRSCAVGPWILLGASEAEIREWPICIEIVRNGQQVFVAETPIGNIRRNFDDLVGYLFRSQRFSSGVVLLTGTGIVPSDTFSLQPGDQINIDVPKIGTLRNHVVTV
jgi:2-dehydro-3-deoxy-D-arabinonate dehydratase